MALAMGSRTTLEAAPKLRNVTEKNFQQMNEARDQELQRVRDAAAAENVSVPGAAA